MVVPESPNNMPENPDLKGPEAQAVNSLQQDAQIGSVDFNNSVFGDQSGIASAAGLPDLAFSNDGSSDQGSSLESNDKSFSDQIADMTMEELDLAASETQAQISGIENQIALVTTAAQGAEVQNRAKQLADADAYFANA